MLKKSVLYWVAFDYVNTCLFYDDMVVTLGECCTTVARCSVCIGVGARCVQLESHENNIRQTIHTCEGCYKGYLSIRELFAGVDLAELTKWGALVKNALLYKNHDMIRGAKTGTICDQCSTVRDEYAFAAHSIEFEQYDTMLCLGCTSEAKCSAEKINSGTVGHAVFCVRAVQTIAGNKDVLYCLSQWIAKVMLSDRAILDALRK